MNRLMSRRIMAVAADQSGFDISDLTGQSKMKPVSVARQRTMLALRTLRPDLSYALIGKLMGGRDHSTVIHACRSAEARARADKDEAAALADLIASCREISANQVQQVDTSARRRNVDRLEHAINLVAGVLADLEHARDVALDTTGELFEIPPASAVTPFRARAA